MKKCLVLLALMIPGAICLACCERCIGNVPTKNYKPDSAVYAMLGRTMTDVLFHPNKVTCYTLRGKSQVAAGDYEVEPHWIRDSLLGRLNPEMVGVLQYALIANPENYKFDSIRIRAPYMPEIVFEFQKKKHVVHVIISPSDRTWTIMYDDKRQVHFNYHDRELMDRFCNIFLTD